MRPFESLMHIRPLNKTPMFHSSALAENLYSKIEQHLLKGYKISDEASFQKSMA
jgi:hypothetical protein